MFLSPVMDAEWYLLTVSCAKWTCQTLARYSMHKPRYQLVSLKMTTRLMMGAATTVSSQESLELVLVCASFSSKLEELRRPVPPCSLKGKPESARNSLL